MRAWLSIGALAFIVETACGAGLAHNEDFLVFAPDQPLAEAVLAKAVEYRREIAAEWLGEELPPSVGRVTIHVELTDQRADRALFWPIDSSDRKMHKLWLTTTREAATGSTLAHEMTHVVLATQFGSDFPAWCDEGIASRRDDEERQQTRARILSWYAKSDNWPDLKPLLQAESISAEDRARYSVAASLTSFLLTLGSKETLLAFVADGQTQGWDAALESHYHLRDVAELQSRWQAWASRASDTRLSVSDSRTPAGSRSPADTR